MIGAHLDREGEYVVRRDEHPLKRKNPGGKDVWVARWTDKDGDRRYGWKERGVPGSGYAKGGPCRRPVPEGTCCAQHAIHRCYELERDAPERVSTLEDYALRQWLRLHPRSPRSNASYTSTLRGAMDVRVEGERFGGLPLAGVERKHAVMLIDALLRAGRAVRGVQSVVSALSTMWQDALDDGFVKAANPFMRHKIRRDDPRVRKPGREPRVLSWETMHAIAAASGRWEVMLRTLSDAGLRMGEAIPVQHRDVKLGNRCDELTCKVEGSHLHVRRKAWRSLSLDGTKGPTPGRSRVAPLTEWLASSLAVSHDGGSTALMFPTVSGLMWLPGNWYDTVWKAAVEKVGVDATPHDFRHSWVTYVRAAGIDGADASAAAGHTLAVQDRVYTHSLGRSFEAMRRAVGE